MSEKVREFVKAVRNNDDNEVKRTLTNALKEKVVERLRNVKES